MQKLYSSEDRVFIYLLQAKLAGKNIHSFIKNEEPCGPAAGDIPPVVATPELWLVEEHYLKEAMQIIEEEITRLNTHHPKWKCPQCGEHLDGQFEICWKCGASKV